MQKINLKEVKPPERFKRKCGHWNDQTLDLVEDNGIIKSYCIGCLVEMLSLPPVAEHQIINGKLEKIWGE